MEDINWQDPFKKESLEEANSDKGSTKKQSNSFADQFIRSGRKEDIANGQQRLAASNGSDIQAASNGSDIEAAQNKRVVPPDLDAKPAYDDGSRDNEIQPESSAGNVKIPTFSGNAIQDEERNYSSSWKFLDLKNKKQTGDLFKKIVYYQKKDNSKVFNFVSSRGREGVSTILANLVDYVDFHTKEKKILAIDANLKSSDLDKIFNIPNNTLGLSDIFNNRVGVREAATPISSNVFILCTGQDNAKLSGNLVQENFIKLIDYYSQEFDFIFIDCPPVLSSSDALSVAPAADITFLIIQSGEVQRQVVEKSKTLLENDECRIGGVVLNCVPQVIPRWVYRFI